MDLSAISATLLGSSLLTGTDPERNVFDLIRTVVARQLAVSLSTQTERVYACIDVVKKGQHDFTVPIARLRLPGKADLLAQKAASEFVPNALIESVTAAGAFLNISLRTSTFVRLVLERIYSASHPPEGSTSHSPYGSNTQGQGKKVVVEFSSPNIAKPFHAGHMRSTIIGTFLSNIYKANGWDVIRLNYLGDWGTQYGLLAVGFQKYGSEEALQADAIIHLFDVYVSISNDVKAEKAEGRDETKDQAKEYFRKLEEGDETALALWHRFRDFSIVEYVKIYERLNVHFDVYAGESLVAQVSIQDVMEQLKAKGLLTTKTKEESRKQWGKVAEDDILEAEPEETTDSALALAVDLNAFKLGKPVVQKPDGTTIYQVRDIAGAIERFDRYKFDKMIYVVGDQQDLHFAQCFKILSLLDVPFADRLEHVSFGRVKGMSTRSGDVVFLKEILDVAKETMLRQTRAAPERFAALEDPEGTSDQIGMTAVKIQDMQGKRAMSYSFDWKRMTSFEGDTGPYLQYAHVRLCSIERKVAPGLVLRSSPEAINTDLLVEPKAREIVFHLASFPDVVRTALKSHEPSTIVTFCFKLAHLISSAWETLLVKGQEKEVAQARLLLYTGARDVLGSAMRMLSLTPLERM